MAEDPVIEPKLESQDAETPTKINRKRRREFEERNAANPPLRTKRFRGALLAVHKPSHCLKKGVGSLQFADESLRFQHRVRLFRLLGHMLRRHNWAEASGVLSVLLKGTVKDRSISVNRTKYKAALELLSVLSVIEGEKLAPKKIQNVYGLWMKKLGNLKFRSTKDRFAVQLELILSCLLHGRTADAIPNANWLPSQHGFDGDPRANLVVGLVLSQCWYSYLLEQIKSAERDASSTCMQSEIPIEDAIHMPTEYSKEYNIHEEEANSILRCDSNTSVANDKEETADSNQHKKSINTDVMVKKEASHSSYIGVKSAEETGINDTPSSNYMHPSSNCTRDLSQVSIYRTQGLPPWLLPLKLPLKLPMKLPSSHKSLGKAIINRHKDWRNTDYDNAVKYLRVALHSTPPAIEALHPLIQMLILGDQVDEALYELETLSNGSDTVLQLRLQAGLLEHFDSGNYVKLCVCFEDILKKDPTCSDSLSRLVLMHRRGEYETQSLVEMIALHLDASRGTCDAWQELASCLLQLSQCEGDRASTCNGGEGRLNSSNKIPELFTCGESGKGWRLRTRWWLNRHFCDRILMSDIASGEAKLLTYKAAAASHIYGRHFKYVVKTTEYLEKEDDMEHYSFLQTHILNSVGFCTVQGRTS